MAEVANFGLEDDDVREYAEEATEEFADRESFNELEGYVSYHQRGSLGSSKKARRTS